MSEDQGLEPGTRIAEKYEVRRRIGAGGMGAVYEVEHLLTKRLGALKILHPSFNSVPAVVERFIREASAAGRIGSPHIIETYDAGHAADGSPYIFMELLLGQTLEEKVEHEGQLEIPLAVAYVRQACRGLEAAHAAGIIHRDIKPENLFVTSGPSPLVKILDFGISKFDPALTQASKMTVEGQALGTPYYMSPEQVLGRGDLDAQTDVYSLGVTLYHCLTGRLPFVAETLPAISVLIHEGHFAAASSHRPDLPAELDSIIGRAMAVDKAVRYGSVAEFAAALAPFAKASLEPSRGPSTETRRFGGLEEAATLVGADSSSSAQSPRRQDAKPALAGSQHTLPPVTGTLPGLSKRPALPWLLVPALGGLLALAVWGFGRSSTDEEASGASGAPPIAPTPASPSVLSESNTGGRGEEPGADQGGTAGAAPRVSPSHAVEAEAPQPKVVTLPRKPASPRAPKPAQSSKESEKSSLKKGRLGSEFTQEFE